MNRKQTVRPGFTLIEILVVLAIVGLLTALLFPVFAKVRDSGRTTSCASNLSQIGKAIALYVNDNNQKYPPIIYAPNCTWVDSIYPYAKSTEVFSCPSANYGKYVPGCGTQDAIDGIFGAWDGHNGSYDMVSPLIEAQTTINETGTSTKYIIPPKTISQNRYRFPSSTILVLDGSDISYMPHIMFAVVNPGIDPITSVDDLADGGVLPRHKDGVNLLYVDGHVKWQQLEALTSTPMWRYDGREAVVPTPTPVS